MCLQGSLNTLRIPELFSLLQGMRKTGVLTLLTEDQEICFAFRGGGLIYASAKDPEKKIGRYLKRLGVSGIEDYEPSQSEDNPAHGYFGQRQVELGRVSPKDLRAAVKEQALDLLDVSLSWRHGAFYFEDGELPFGAPQDSPISTHSAVLEATRRADEKALLRDTFPDLQVVLTRMTTSTQVASAQDAEILPLVDGKRTVDNIIFESPTDPRTTVTALKSLVIHGVIAAVSTRSEPNRAEFSTDIQGLPISPSVPGKLFSILHTEGLHVPRLVNLLADDPILAAASLRACCTGGEILPRAKTSLSTITTTLGLPRLRALLVPEALRALYFPGAQPFWKELWEHSILCGRLSREVALKARFPYPEEAYLAGLLHNLGAYALFRLRPEEYQSLVDESEKIGADLEGKEERVFGLSHSRAGELMAQAWAFPTGIINVIKSHTRSEPNANNPLLDIVNVALGAMDELGFRLGFSRSLQGQLRDSLKALNLQKSKVLSLLGIQPRPVVKVSV